MADWVRKIGTMGGLLIRSKMAHPWGMHLSKREEVIFHIVIEGACWLRRKGEAPVQLLQGDLVLLPQGLGHDLVHHPKGKAEPVEQLNQRESIPQIGDQFTTLICGTYCLDAQIAQPVLRALPPIVHFSASKVRSNAGLAATLGLLTAELEHPGVGSEALIQHLFDVLFFYVFRAWVEESADYPGWFSALKDRALSKALTQIHTRPSAPWTVETLAQEAGLSRAAFARRFTQMVGETPLAYLTRCRMALAARLLLESDISLAEIARSVGYDNEFAFSRAFKRSRGIAPTTYRRAESGQMPVRAGAGS